MKRLRIFGKENRAELTLVGLALVLLLVSCGRADDPPAPAMQPDMQVTTMPDPCERGGEQ